MDFRAFWKQNKARYLEIAKLDVKLALHTACEDAWDLALSNTVSGNEKPQRVISLSERAHDDGIVKWEKEILDDILDSFERFCSRG